ncbi:hypothetical protein ACHQM5_020618 [Ranunculus cassubicifolius]
MGKSKSKTSRKGKKAWRTNIPTDDIDEYFEKSTKDALTGGSLTSLPTDSLFYVDKSTDFSAKRKIEKHREKVLHCDSTLLKNPFVKAIPSSILKKSNNNNKKIINVQGKQVSKKSKPSLIPAVELEPPGCSFNPSAEAHEDALASAVAGIMQEQYKNELGPTPVPLTVPGEAIDEESMLLLDVDDGNDDDVDEENLDDNDTATERLSKRKRVTRVELNRRIRRRAKLKTEEEEKKIEKLSKEIDSLPDIMKEIAKEDEEKKRKHDRRAITRQERLKSAPPRLGRHKFVPAPPEVLLSEEISGSLRKLKGCCTLTRDRFKSYQKRGLIVPGPNGAN